MYWFQCTLAFELCKDCIIKLKLYSLHCFVYKQQQGSVTYMCMFVFMYVCSHPRCIFLSDSELLYLSHRYAVGSLQHITSAYLYAISVSIESEIGECSFRFNFVLISFNFHLIALALVKCSSHNN